MYRKHADRLIIRDVRNQLKELKLSMPWADWQMAVLASAREHPDWYVHHSFLKSIKPLLQEGGIDLTETEKPFSFVVNGASED